ncbi:non-canonical purine NTP pyrophosphatase [Clostridium sp. D2Q-11]|uniref:Non-canonical purine NTP pyrophosphatase n=1 Tax=Anaeromonas frigoriresistens TaxID=2683708 RepID=A0A942UVQ3_9FIRM|nr:non-canonical purine NTP pyrophosphatase [Anaeromonas frigoriresistens]
MEIPVDVVSLKELGIESKVKEDGKNPLEISIKKAKQYYEEAKIPTFSIDAGLYIDKFSEDKQPGVYVRRIYDDREEVSDEEMLDYYIKELEKCGGESKGCWKISLTLVLNEKEIQSTIFERETYFTSKKCKEISCSEPLNSIQIDKKTNKYLAQQTAEEKKHAQHNLSNHIYEFMKKNLV